MMIVNKPASLSLRTCMGDLVERWKIERPNKVRESVRLGRPIQTDEGHQKDRLKMEPHMILYLTRDVVVTS